MDNSILNKLVEILYSTRGNIMFCHDIKDFEQEEIQELLDTPSKNKSLIKGTDLTNCGYLRIKLTSLGINYFENGFKFDRELEIKKAINIGTVNNSGNFAIENNGVHNIKNNNEKVNTKNRFERNPGLITAISVIVAIIIAIIGWFIFSPKEETKINQTQTNPFNSPQVANSPGTVINYTDTKDPNYLNPRSELLKGLQPIDLVYRFFELQNQGGGGYRDACGLLQKNKPNFKGCDSQDGSDVERFSSYVKTFLYGYENVYVTGSNQMVNTGSQIVCVRFDYTPNSVNYTGKVSEYYRYKLNIREDGEREISSRVCEDKVVQGIGHRTCGNNQPGNKICLPYLQ